MLAACASLANPNAPPKSTAPNAKAGAFYATQFERHPSTGELTQLGRRLFADVSLSASGKLACASCHDPAYAYGPAGDGPVAMGGPNLTLPGVRAVPSLTYRQATPAFSEHFKEADGDDSLDQGPAGGWDWDGRASSAHEQAAAPLLSPFEMANSDAIETVGRLRLSPSAFEFRRVFGLHALDDEKKAWVGLLLALEVFQQNPADFYPYTSKYDAWLRGEVELSPNEKRGLDLFNDPDKGNCASCHPSAIRHGELPQFTDYGFIALGAPRNLLIPANADPHYFDLGLCGPYRTDLRDKSEYCGRFKTPSLRNVALRRTFFHNGVFTNLEDVVRFYVERDLHPERIYSAPSGAKGARSNDLPEQYVMNLNREGPFNPSSQSAALSPAEMADLVSFLKTLTDGYRSPS